MKPLITVDGAAGTGKGTLSKKLAEHYGFQHLDSGLMYRAVASLVMETGRDAVQVAEALTAIDLERPGLRSEEVSRFTPTIAKEQRVRDAINVRLRQLLEEGDGNVIDGRVGGYEFPQAEVKIFLTTSAEARAERRCAQLKQLENIEAKYEDVLRDINERDRKDRDHVVAPLKPAPDAYVIDNSTNTIDETFALAVEICDRHLASVA